MTQSSFAPDTEQRTSPQDAVSRSTCPRCASPLDAEHVYCPRCGQLVAAGAVDDVGSEEDREIRRRIGGTTWVRPTVGDAAPPMASIAIAPDPAHDRPRRRRKRGRPWFKRPFVVVPLVVLLGIVSVLSVAAYRAQSTIQAMQRVSDAPAYVTDNTQGAEAKPAGAPSGQTAGDAIPDAGFVPATGLRFDTGPAQQALSDAGVATKDDGGVFGSFRDTAAGVGDLAAGAAVAAGVTDPSKDAVNILVMGVDARPGNPIDLGVRADALMVLHLNPSTGACRGLAVPRDSLVELPGYGKTKVNHALMVGGIAYEQLVVEQFLDLKIDHYVLVDFTGFEQLVDAVGGVTVNVPHDLVDSKGKVIAREGSQTFDGATALRYARYRGEQDVDVGRVRRQQQLIRGLIDTAQGRNLATEATKLLPALKGHIRTDLTPAELVSFAEQYRTDCAEGKLLLDTLQGSFAPTGSLDPLFQEYLVYQIIDPAVVEAKVQELSAP